MVFIKNFKFALLVLIAIFATSPLHASCPVSGTITIDNNVTWNNLNPPPNPVNYEKIIITGNGRLTISGITVKFAANSQIIVERTGRLVVDNATLTLHESCIEKLWATEFYGSPIVVYGDKNTPPYDQNGNPSAIHGTVHFENSTLSNSIGIKSLQGGVIKVINSEFVNNPVSIYVEDYDFDNHTAKIEASNFYWNQDLIFDGSAYPYEVYRHIVLDNVQGVQIRGVQFYLDDPLPVSAFDRGTGIEMTNAGVQVMPSDYIGQNSTTSCPEFGGSSVKTGFNNMSNGINASGDERLNVWLRNTEFHNNLVSVKIKGGHEHFLAENTFTLNDTHHFGNRINLFFSFLTFSDTASFTATRNSFYSSHGVSWLQFVTFKNAAKIGFLSRFYDNTFDTDGSNCIANTFTENNPEIQVNCNHYNGFRHDWLVQYYGIIPPQGDLEECAGNTFSPNAIPQIKIDDPVNFIFWYYYYPNAPGGNIHKEQSRNENPCHQIPCSEEPPVGSSFDLLLPSNSVHPELFEIAMHV